MPELAKKIAINHQTSTIHIDGAEFPWYVADTGIDVTADPHAISVVHLPILADHVEIIPADSDQ